MKVFHSCYKHTLTPKVKNLACILPELLLCNYKYSLLYYKCCLVTF